MGIATKVLAAASALPLALATGVVTPSDRSSTEWVTIIDDEDASWSIKKGSFEFMAWNGAEGGSVLGQRINKDTNNVSYEKWFVSQVDCSSGFGTLLAFSLDGKLKSSGEYVDSGQNIASHVGWQICRAIRSRNE